MDNFMVVGPLGDEAETEAKAWEAQLNRSGLPTHPVEGGQVAKFVGLEFDGKQRLVQISPARAWKLRLAMEQLLSQTHTHGCTLEALLGHYTWLAMMRRPCLCVFSHAYLCVRRAAGQAFVIDRTLRAELTLAKNLLPMLFADLGLPWSDTVYACDASMFGLGVVSRTLPRNIVEDTGRRSERWRHRLEGAVDARRHALSEAVLTGDLADPDKVEAALRSMGGPCQPCEHHSGEDERDFAEVDARLLNEADWQLVYRGTWHRKEKILRLEACSLVWVIKHIARARAGRNSGT